MIIRALPHLEKKIPKICYFHIGEEDDSHSERKLAKDLTISSKVEFLGYKNDIRPYLWAADVFVMPSRYEGFSIAALEAIACGVPTILSDVPGLSEWKQYGIDSIIYTEADPQQLANNILLMLRSPIYPTIDQLEMIKGLYGVKRGATEYLNLYTQW